MKRWIAGGVAVGCLAVGRAAEPAPVSVYPPTPGEQTPATTLPGTMVPAPRAMTRPVTQPGAPDVTKPLSSVLDPIPPAAAAPPATPAVFPDHSAGCATCDACAGQSSAWSIPRLNLGLGSSPCVDRLRSWFGWKAGPRVMPAFTPTPYQPPLRHYFPVNPNPSAAPAAQPGCAPGERAPLFGPRLAGGGRVGGNVFGGGCRDGNCGRGGRCDGCYEGPVERTLGHLCPRQFDRKQPNCWGNPTAPGVSDCARGGCDGTTAAAVGAVPAGGGIYPGVGGGYRFASHVYVPPAPAVVASASYGGGGVGGGVTGGTSGGAIGGNVGAVGTGTPGTGGGTGTGGTGR